MFQVNRCPDCGSELPAGSLHGLCPKCLLAAGLESRDDVDRPIGSGSGAPTTPHSGSFVAPEPAALATHFPQLEILELLGQGGMGAVYKARQPRLDRLVALKIIRPESADTPAFAERFNREARMLARLSHPQIVAVYDFGSVAISLREMIPHTEREEHTDLYYFLMEYVDGPNLRELMRTGELTPPQALAIVPQVCEALQYAHDEGVVHRDIKPENILLDKRGRVKIADFGLAKLAGRTLDEFTLTGTHQVMGTPRYMAPEQMEGSHGVDHRADIYSLGVVFYEMLTGEVPIGQFEPPSKKVEVDVRLDEVVLRALAREPERRYQQASDVKSEVESISKTSSPAQIAGLQREAALQKPKPQWPAELDAARSVQNPAWGLIITGIISWITIPLAYWLPIVRDLDAAQRTVFQISFGVVPLVVGTTMALAGFCMRRLEGYRLAMFAAVLPIVVLVLKLIGLSFGTLAINPADWVGAPIGLWALVVLSRSDVRSAFQSKDRTETGGHHRVTPGFTAGLENFAAIRQQLTVPATLLQIAGLFLFPVAIAIAVLFILGKFVEDALLTYGIVIAMLIVGGLFFVSGWRLKRLQDYGLGLATCILTLPVSTVVPALFLFSNSPGLFAPLFLLFPVATWLLVLLRRPEVKAAFGNQGAPGSSQASAAGPTRRGTLGVAWDDWWADRDRWVTRGVQIVLMLFVSLCLLLFINVRSESRLLPDMNGRLIWNSKVDLGLSFSPWFQMEKNPGGILSGNHSIVFSSWSWLLMLAGHVAWCVNWQIEKAIAKTTGKKLRWSNGSPGFGVALWGVAIVVALAAAILMARTPESRDQQPTNGPSPSSCYKTVTILRPPAG